MLGWLGYVQSLGENRHQEAWCGSSNAEQV